MDELIPAVESSPFERAEPSEAEQIAAIAEVIEQRVRAQAAADPPARRDAHPKMHGCVEAELKVLDGLPPELAKGLFARPAAYQAWVRFSNGAATPAPDKAGDGRGMAIKVMGVAASSSGTQDLVMINHPTFFVANVSDYVAFNRSPNPFKFFVPDLNPLHVHLHDMLIALSIAAEKVSNPLNSRYWSMTPYLYGDRPCKYSARPVGPPSPFEDRSTPDFLRDNLVRALGAGEATFEFCIQLQADPATMPVEDPTIEWREDEAPFTPVARLTILRQGFDTPERRAFGENLSFTPWHGLEAHRPLGGVNRVRRTVYAAISGLRHELNGTVSVEPTHCPPEIPPPAPTPTEAPVADSFFDRFMGLAGEVVDDIPWADDAASMTVINALVHTTITRPHPWSTASDYTSWKALFDRTYQARQLPVSSGDPATLPPVDKVVAIFQRPAGEQLLSAKSTCLFPAFAQYLTDGFIRTGVPGQPETAANRARTSSNHEIDLCPLYGRLETQTDALRLNDETAGRRGRLKSQMIGGEEFPPFLYIDGGTQVDPQFEATLDPPLLSDPPPPAAQLASLFAVGGDRANSTPFAAMINTLLLREHNRVAGQLEAQNDSWDDERVFQTARNIIIPMFIKVVVEQYINHITPLPFNLVANPQVAWSADWNRPNWITAEFSLLYRWHALMPDAIAWPGGAPIPLAQFPLDNRPLLASGLAAAFGGAAAQPAAEIGALNTNASLLIVEQLAIGQGRSNRIQSYNAYRVQYGVSPVTSFGQISSNPGIVAALEAAYASVDEVEFYPGIFAEDRVAKSPLPGLMMRMVGVDAFSQALTNPLLSQHVFNAQTFTPWGFQLIQDTHDLGQILQRNCPPGAVEPEDIVMTQKGWRY